MHTLAGNEEASIDVEPSFGVSEVLTAIRHSRRSPYLRARLLVNTTQMERGCTLAGLGVAEARGGCGHTVGVGGDCCQFEGIRARRFPGKSPAIPQISAATVVLAERW